MRIIEIVSEFVLLGFRELPSVNEPHEAEIVEHYLTKCASAGCLPPFGIRLMAQESQHNLSEFIRLSAACAKRQGYQNIAQTPFSI